MDFHKRPVWLAYVWFPDFKHLFNTALVQCVSVQGAPQRELRALLVGVASLPPCEPPGLELRPPGLATRAFTPRVISLGPGLPGFESLGFSLKSLGSCAYTLWCPDSAL